VDEPTNPDLIRVKSRVTAETWQKRVAQAKADESTVKAILKRVAEGASLNTAIAKELPENRRSWAIRQVPAYRRRGIEALIDARLPREPKVSIRCREVVQKAREANPRLTTEQALRLLREGGVSPLPSESTIKREFSKVDERRKYARKKAKREDMAGVEPPVEKVEEAAEIVALPFAGGELLMAAELEAGGITVLTEEVVLIGKRAIEASAGKVPTKDVAYRDSDGHFTSTYNRRRTRKGSEQTASYLRSAEEKAEGRVPSWARFTHERPATIDAKLRMLVVSWMVVGSKGWDSLRAPDVAGLEALTGFAYMPSTLAKFVSALAISGAGDVMLEAVGRQWHEVAKARWQEPGAMAALYIDNHVKEVWSSLFTLSGKVSHLNRVMPCITTTYAHTGAGTPLVLSVQSGSAPLAPRLVQLVARAEKVLETDVQRAVVIDAEGSTFDLLESFAAAKRVLITPLKPSRVPDLELTYSPGSYYRPYRDHDELRIAQATLLHKSTGRSLEIGALLVRRAHREADTVLLTTGLELGMEGRDLADLYFRRWPVQENFFKDAGVLGLSQHRGNCGTIVSNVAVISELERMESRANRDAEALAQLTADAEQCARTAEERDREDQRAQSALATRRGRLDDLIAQGKTSGKMFAASALDHQRALVQAESCGKAAAKARAAAEKNNARRAKLETRRDELAARRARLEPQRTIRKLDVAQDAILTAAKLTAVQLICFVLREYLSSLAMTPETFIQRVFTIHGRKELRMNEELVVFYENSRDPAINDALRDACGHLNKRALQREGRTLRFAVETGLAVDGQFV
jgi:hypothetical protein